MPPGDHDNPGTFPDPERQRLIRSAFVSSPLAIVAEAISVASEQCRSVYIDRDAHGWRWSPATRGGPYPLLRITARFLRCDYFRIVVGCRSLDNGVCVLKGAPEEPRPNLSWAILDIDAPVPVEIAAEMIQAALPPDLDPGSGRRDR